MTDLGALADANYVQLTTFRKDGTPVATPVWAVARDGKLFVWTEAESWKVKRIRRNPAVTLQPCNARGALTEGTTAVPGTARILDSAETETVRKALQRKYWLLGPLLILASRIRRGKDGTTGIEITLD
ncbi:PPOX class F420-dependent oxidoreductase [Nocardia camponoti]|uniref:Pyridoxamine 5'-phosphate oxidase N-terminal domain-containing protein n=1 Tax=Nocardia camponoti TaxID=1616106 RepID=A0A917Q8V6_9NOCA|nr:PPOX class F420-dependent oxidoreductase [Nocardia camponoti]GGK36908.1 hypothetical protein GCM10011591_05760 [Nocardia camponoti]